jgi:Protein of unknown function (DUF4058)
VIGLHFDFLRSPETLVMRSPFPGMDPYLEQFWGDVHHTMINRSRAAIQKQLPDDLVARVDERVFVEPSVGVPRNIIPDVRVVERGQREEPVLRASNGIAVAEPLVVHIEQDDPIHQGFIEIIDLKSGRRVVTVIEIVRPSNKVSGPGRDSYVKKQDELRDAGVSLVEIDLNRTGKRVMSAPFELIPDGHRTPYAACVRRGWKSLGSSITAFPCVSGFPQLPCPYGSPIGTSHSIFRPYSRNAARKGGTSMTSTTAKNPIHHLATTMPSGPTHCSESRATDSSRSSPVDEPFNRD